MAFLDYLSFASPTQTSLERATELFLLPTQANGRLEWATWVLAPITPIQRPVLNRLRDVGDGQVFRPFEVGDRSRNFQDAVVGPSRQPLLQHGALQQLFRVGR